MNNFYVNGCISVAVLRYYVIYNTSRHILQADNEVSPRAEASISSSSTPQNSNNVTVSVYFLLVTLSSVAVYFSRGGKRGGWGIRAFYFCYFAVSLIGY